MTDSVWIVQDDGESSFHAVLGLFATEDEAAAFAEDISDRFARGVIYTSMEVGYRYDRGPGHAMYGPQGWR